MIKRPVLIAIALLLVSSCSTTELTKSWTVPNVSGRTFENIMVIAVTRESEPSLREKMELHLVDDLLHRGHRAQSSVVKYGADGFYKMDSLAAYNKLLKDHVDAVITIVLLNKTKESYYVPRRSVDLGPRTPEQMWDYHKDLLNKIETPGYYKEAVSYFWESNFYDLNKKELIYSARTESFDPASINALGHSHGLMIVKDIVHKRVLPKHKVIRH